MGALCGDCLGKEGEEGREGAEDSPPKGRAGKLEKRDPLEEEEVGAGVLGSRRG